MSSDYKRNPWVRFQWAVRHEGQPLWTHLTIPKRNTVTLEVIKKKTKLDSPCRCMASLQCELSCVWAACTLHWKVSTDEDTPEAVKVNQKFAQRIWQLGLSVVTSQKQGKSSQPFLCSMWEEVTWSTRYFFSVNSRPQLRHLQASTPVPWTQLCHNMVFLYWVSRSQFMSRTICSWWLILTSEASSLGSSFMLLSGVSGPQSDRRLSKVIFIMTLSWDLQSC